MKNGTEVKRRGAETRSGKYTLSDAKDYVAANIEDIMLGFEQCKEIPHYLRKSVKFIEVWKAGCWLNMMLKRDLGAAENEAYDIGFCHGQRSVFGDPWEWAVRYANEYAATGHTADKPGMELADSINREALRSPR
jgi:hypothetical protein